MILILHRFLETIKKNNSIETLVKDQTRHFREYETNVTNAHRRKSIVLINREMQIKIIMTFDMFDKQKFF